MNGIERRANRYMDKVLVRDSQGKTKTGGSSRALKKMFGSPLPAIGVALFALIILSAIFAPLLTPYDPNAIDMRAVLEPPSTAHPLGTDKIGRDVLARILYGGRISILIGLGSAVGAGLIGAFFGVIGGYKRGWLDATLLRLSELFMAFPQIILVLMLVSIVGQSITNLILIFVLTGWASIYRMARSQVLSIREEEYIAAQKAFGIGALTIGLREILPNAVGPIAVNITLSTAMFILQEASLSFLGLGVPMEMATWGNILNVANDLSILRNNWWLWAPVGIVISLFVLSINFIGDGLRDSTDPNQQG